MLFRSVTVSVSCFIPKPFTPFQWDAQDPLPLLKEKQQYLRTCITDKHIKYNYHDAEVSQIEAVFARGDRRLAPVILHAVESGLVFDAWTEHFHYDRWIESFRACGVDPTFYANRAFREDEVLPWDVIDCGVTKEFLLRERKKAYASRLISLGELTADS